MGIGDELMAAGEARRRAAGRALRYQILDAKGRAKWVQVWAGNRHIAEIGHPYHEQLPGYVDGLRPYLAATSQVRFEFKEYQPAPAEIMLDGQAKAMAARTRGAIVFNPTIKMRASPNKDWGLANWKVLIARALDLRWVQIGEPGQPRLRGAEELPTTRFLDAVGALSGARAAIVHEGALHHAAAALGVPTIVIRGGFISPKVTGYAGQVDFYVEDETYPLGCGMRVPCGHCKQAMGSISAEAVLQALRGLLAPRKDKAA